MSLWLPWNLQQACLKLRPAWVAIVTLWSTLEVCDILLLVEVERLHSMVKSECVSETMNFSFFFSLLFLINNFPSVLLYFLFSPCLCLPVPLPLSLERVSIDSQLVPPPPPSFPPPPPPPLPAPPQHPTLRLTDRKQEATLPCPRWVGAEHRLCVVWMWYQCCVQKRMWTGCVHVWV